MITNMDSKISLLCEFINTERLNIYLNPNRDKKQLILLENILNDYLDDLTIKIDNYILNIKD
jgi:hypothetical protein